MGSNRIYWDDYINDTNRRVRHNILLNIVVVWIADVSLAGSDEQI